MLNEKKLSKAELAKREDLIMSMKKNKRNLVKKYGSDAEKVMYGRATNLAKKLAEQDMEQNKLREMVRAALMQPMAEKKEFPDLTGDGKVTKADILKGRGVELDEALNQAVVLTDKDHDLLMKNGSVAVNVGGETVVVALKDFEVDLENADYEDPYLGEDLDLGHQDNEPHMLKADLYRIGKYAMELYQMVDEFEGKGEVDFPHWWQAKIITAKNNLVGAKHYLDFETKEPQIDAAVDVIDMSGTLDNIGVEEPLEEGWKEWVVGGLLAATTLAGIGKAYAPKMDQLDSGDEVELAQNAYADAFKKMSDEDVENIYTQVSKSDVKDDLKQNKFAFSSNTDKETIDAAWPDMMRASLETAVANNINRFVIDSSGTVTFIANPAGFTALEEGLPKGYWKEKIPGGMDESYDTLVKKIKGQGKSEKAAKAIAGAVAAYKAKGGGKGPTAKQKK